LVLESRVTGFWCGRLPRHDAALAVLLYTGHLWGWAFDIERPPGIRGILSSPDLGPLADRAAMLASGAAVPDGAAATDLPFIAQRLHREIRDHGDDIRGG
jgi:hypothetical protein